MEDVMAQENSTYQEVKSENMPALSVDKILMAEFKYAQETAAQAMEDRHRMVNYYLIIVGVIMNVIVGLMKESDRVSGGWISAEESQWLIVILFLTLFIVGILYLYKLIRLRWMWYGSAEVMNKIKDYYDENLGKYHLKEKAFIWTTKTLKAMKLGSCKTLYFGSAILIILINAMSLSGAVYFLWRNLLYGISAFVIFSVLEVLFYKIMLKREKSL
jgi:hypothetical protein